MVTCKHIGETLSGEIKRFRPDEESFKKWNFSGRVRNDLIFAVFWTADEKTNPGSYGTIQLHRLPARYCEGHYEKWVLSSDGSEFTGKLQQAKLKWMSESEVPPEFRPPPQGLT
ncbi:hypothetical protein [Marichromatium gracile]|uniref:hypothetical protein n=2 Tax=Marichromatium gracile TaxID=1048 RepID=UPI00104AEBDB|nr:hypothetical protein [Marichromatium gracile]